MKAKVHLKKIENYTYFTYFCPSCEDFHSVPIAGGSTTWQFNGNEASPTLTPSVRVMGLWPSTSTHCHHNITDGKIIFHNDNPQGHKFNGQTLDLPESEVS
jgi:hypothetical protein